MKAKKVINFMDKAKSLKLDSEEEIYYRKLIINELCSNKDEVIMFLLNIDEFNFIYIINFLDEIILRVDSEMFLKEIKEKVFKRYDKLLNININNYEINYSECND